MLEQIKKTITFLNFTNIWVAINISILPVLGANIFKVNFTFIQIVALFILAWMSYSWPLLLTVLTKNYQPKTEKELFFYSNQKMILTFFIINTILVTAILLTDIFNVSIYYRLLVLGFTSFTYVIPFINTGLRQINFLKIIVITFSWAYISILFLPINSQTIYFFGFQWAAIFLITLPFDKKDAIIDTKQGLKTFENTLNFKSKYILKLALALVIIICVQASGNNISIIAFVTLLVIVIPYKNQNWYFMFLDGLPIYQLILFFLTK